MTPRTPWPHQIRGVQEVIDASTRGTRRVVLYSPTGGGKSYMMQLLAREFLERGAKVSLYSNRRLMVEQLSQGLTEAGLFHGIRAAGYDDEREAPMQISSIQTENSKVTKRKSWKLHDANLVIVDECHIQTGNTARAILKEHYDAGALIVGLTATPLGIEDLYDHLVIAGTMSELRACGALVPAITFAPDEPDMREFKKMREGQDPSATQQRTAIMTPSIFGRVWTWYQRLNADRKPCVLFGPGVAESIWFAEKFHSQGISAAHVDGDRVWINGEWESSTNDSRNKVRDLHQAGEIKVVTNRYVLREGVDWPWIEHVILAFVAGSLQTCIQVCGRGLRASPSTGKTHLIIQDHGGSWWRHGSMNEDRHWSLDLTDEIAYGLRAKRLRENPPAQPFLCPICKRTWTVGKVCLPAHGGCGFVLGDGKRSRPVVSTDGELREMVGDIFKPRRLHKGPNGPKIWERMYWRSRTEKGNRTFNAAASLFSQENYFAWPDPTWKFMPLEARDWFRLVADVPMERLVR